jgi:hypothetical protein
MRSRPGLLGAVGPPLAPVLIAACSNGGGSGSSDGSTVTCANPGNAVSGPADDHCKSADGGTSAQLVSPASCYVSQDAGAGLACPYGKTMVGQESDDDRCKYHVVWSSAPVCAGAAGVRFQVRVSYLGSGEPLTDAGTQAETFTTTPGSWDADAYCDDMSSHAGPNSFSVPFVENPPGTYTGPVVFDQPGDWTVRFHFNWNCDDTVPDSPHGHVAFHVHVP